MKLPLIKRIALLLLLTAMVFAGNEYLNLQDKNLHLAGSSGHSMYNLLLLVASILVYFVNYILQYRFRKSNVITG
jgi:hypothetical protein